MHNSPGAVHTFQEVGLVGTFKEPGMVHTFDGPRLVHTSKERGMVHKSGRKCYIARAFSGVPNKGDTIKAQKKNFHCVPDIA